MTLGLKDFFNAVVGDKLLYKIERAQYNEQGAVGGEAIDVYGSAHLLRLLAKINGLLNRNRYVCKIRECSYLIFLDEFLHDFRLVLCTVLIGYCERLLNVIM